MVQSEKTENKFIQNAADQDFEQFDQNGKEILPENATKFMVKELVIPVAHQSVVQNKIQKVPQIEFDHSADIFGFNEVLKDAISLVKVDTLQEGKGETSPYMIGLPSTTKPIRMDNLSRIPNLLKMPRRDTPKTTFSKSVTTRFPNAGTLQSNR